MGTSNGFTTGRKRTGVMAALLAAAIVMAGLAGIAALPGLAAAETVPLEIKTEAGYQGKIKMDRWFPVQLTVTNSGDDLTGDLAVELASPFNGKDTTYHVPLDLPRGTTKTVHLALPGMALTDKNNVISYYKDGVKTGKKVPFRDGDPSIVTQSLPNDAYHVGVVARDPDTMNFLALLNQKGYQVVTVPLKPGDMFSEAMMLDGLDAIVLNDTSGPEWKPAYTEAVRTWLQRGGSLILGGGAAYGKLSAELQELSPVEVRGTGALNTLGTFAQATGKELKLTEPLTVSTGVLTKDSQAFFTEDNVPLVAVKPAGFGKVYYAAYDLSLQPLASWQGNPALWESVLSGGLRPANGFRYGPGYAAIGPAYGEMGQALESFPSLAPPSLGVLLIVLLVYAGVIGPVLYALLKRLDKREWAWIAIPGLAVVVSGGIYLFGASGRGSTLAQALTVIELNGQGQGVKRTAAAVFVPKGGTYEVEAGGNYYAAPIGSGYNGGGPAVDLAGSSDVFVERNTEKARILFKGVPYWSVRKAWLYGEKQEPAGSIGYSLSMQAGVWKGQWENKTKTDLTDLYLYAGNQWYPIGDMKAGETLAFDSASIPSRYTGSIFDAIQAMYPYQGPVDKNSQKRALLQAYIERSQLQNAADPILFGWSRDSSPFLKVNGNSVSVDELKLWVQPVRLNVLSGDTAYLPLGFVKPVAETSTIPVKPEDGSGRMHAGAGEAMLVYRLPHVPGVGFTKFAEVSVYGMSPDEQYEIWNNRLQKYEPLDTLKNGTELGDYEIEGGTAIRIKLTMKREGLTKYPDFAFEGRVNP